MFDPYAIAIISKMHHDEILREAEANRLIATYDLGFEGPVIRLLSAGGSAIAKVIQWASGAFTQKSTCVDCNATC